MRRKFYIKILFGLWILFIIELIVLWYNGKILLLMVTTHDAHYKHMLNNDKILDTYDYRIQRFLNERSASNSFYLELNISNYALQKDIYNKVSQLRKSQNQKILDIRNDKELKRGCQQSCCWSQRKMKQFYNGEKYRLPSFLDRLSHIDMKLLADLHYGELPVPDGVQLTKLTLNLLPCLQNNTLIFVDTTAVDQFFKEIHDKISVNYILITGDSDTSCPINIIDTHLQLLNEIFAGKSRIIHWFAMNCDLGNNQQWKESKIFSCIPQGISQWDKQRYYMQLASGKDDSVYNIGLKTNDYWLLTSFTTSHAPKYRKPLRKLSCFGRLKNVSKCFYHSTSIDLWKYYIHVGRSKFVLSPPGLGMDCYRTWEALYLGSIPIVINNSISSIYEELPVLVVNNYEEINLEVLENIYIKMTNQTYDYRRLYKGYWQLIINSYRNSSELIQIRYSKYTLTEYLI